MPVSQRSAVDVLRDVLECITNAGEPVTVVFATSQGEERAPALHDELLQEAFAVVDAEKPTDWPSLAADLASDDPERIKRHLPPYLKG